jgi:hypothetical protein
MSEYIGIMHVNYTIKIKREVKLCFYNFMLKSKWYNNLKIECGNLNMNMNSKAMNKIKIIFNKPKRV